MDLFPFDFMLMQWEKAYILLFSSLENSRFFSID